MSAILLNVQPGDEVILPSFTFVSTANAFVLRGARPVFADIRPDTLNIDESCLERLITKKTKAVVVVHYGGVACELDSIIELCSRHNLALVEDNAHGLFSKYKGRPLGSFGTFATQSFHETKNFHCGEGGALLINDPAYFERAEIIRDKGTNRSRFFRGQVDKYTWVDIGSSYPCADLLAAFLFAQLELQEQVQLKRKTIWTNYLEGLADWAKAQGIGLPHVPAHCKQSYHLFYLLLHSAEERQNLIDHLKRNGILSVYHYQPLNCSEMGILFGAKKGDCPVAEDISDRLLRLPFYNDLEQWQQDKVIQAVRSFNKVLQS